MEVGSFGNPAWTWNAIFTLAGFGAIIWIMKKGFSSITSAAESRYKLYVDIVNKKKDANLCDVEHEVVNEKFKNTEHIMSEMCRDIKETKKGVDNILTHLTGIKHG